MNILPFFNATRKFVIDNSPGILTGFGVAGAVTSAVLTGRAAFRVGLDASTQYYEEIAVNDNNDVELLSNRHLVKTYWKEFIPGAAVLAGTVVCIVGATTVSSRRTAAITAAFKLSEELAEGYKKKVVETLGAQKHEKMQADLASDRMEKMGGYENFIILGSEVLFFDSMSGRFFISEVEKINKAVNEINAQVNKYYSASLSDFYDKIGLDTTEFSNSVGWNTDELLEVSFIATILSNNKPAIQISYNKNPISGYDRCM
jgi:hypothetical protein